MSEGSSAAAGVAAASAQAGGEGQAQAAEAVASQAQPGQETGDDTDKEESQAKVEKAKAKPAKENTEEVSEEKKEWKPTHKYFDVLKENYPDRKFASDDDVDEVFDEFLNDRIQYHKRGTVANKKLNDVFEAEPKLRSAIADVINNAVPFQVAMAKYYSPEDFTLEGGDDYYADFEKNVKAREASLAKQRADNEARDKNMKGSIETLEVFMKDTGMDKETKDDMMTKFDSMMQEMFSGKISMETLKGIQRMVQFDQAVQEAAEVAEKKGKNQSIKAEMAKDSKPKGDGIPAPAKGGDVKEVKKEKSAIDDIVDFANSKDPFRGRF